MTSFKTTANLDKTRDKYCFLFFPHRNKIGLLKHFAKINKRGCLNKVQGGGKKTIKVPPSCINHPRVAFIVN